MIDSTSNFVEHPELVADRIVNYAGVVGRENLIAGVDCGFGTFAGRVQVDSKIVWIKLQSLAEGARRASKHVVGEGGVSYFPNNRSGVSTKISPPSPSSGVQSYRNPAVPVVRHHRGIDLRCGQSVPHISRSGLARTSASCSGRASG